MNRRERKHMEKQLGLRKKKETREEWMQRISESSARGKETEARMKEVRRVQEQGKKDENEAQEIASIAIDLMINHDVPYVEAQEQAKAKYKERKEKLAKKRNNILI